MIRLLGRLFLLIIALPSPSQAQSPHYVFSEHPHISVTIEENEKFTQGVSKRYARVSGGIVKICFYENGRLVSNLHAFAKEYQVTFLNPMIERFGHSEKNCSTGLFKAPITLPTNGGCMTGNMDVQAGIYEITVFLGYKSKSKAFKRVKVPLKD